MGAFDVDDIVNIAVRIEENGGAFYRFAAQMVSDKKAKDLFSHLAVEEDKHKNTFETLRTRLKTYPAPETYPGEYGAYLQDYVDGSIVFSKAKMKESLSRIATAAEALAFAIESELDSMLYYHEMKALLPHRERTILDEIIAEERKHFEQLSAMKKTICKEEESK
ncbi:MAG: ferritin family protein [Deltaproteobacteria bacterium]|nr:ferritin family protein [Deltaproteobacteria bacterium]